MSEFRVQLNPDNPYDVIYLGIGENENGQRQAVFARQLERDVDVGLWAWPRHFARYCEHLTSENPLLVSTEDVYRRGIDDRPCCMNKG